MSYQKLSERGFSDGQIEAIKTCIAQRIGQTVVPSQHNSEFSIKFVGQRGLILKILGSLNHLRVAFNVWTNAEEKLKLRAYLQDQGAASWSFSCGMATLSPKFKKGRNKAIGNVVVFAPNGASFSADDLYNNRDNLASLACDILGMLEGVNYFTFDCSDYREADESDAEPEEEDASSELDGSNHQAWLLSWNPEDWNEWNYPDLCQTTNSANPFEDWWRCKNTHPKNGDEVYLYKTAPGPNGIMAHGSVIEESKHGRDIGLDEKHDYIRVAFDRVLDFSKLIISLKSLNERIPAQTWNSRSSGIEIRPECVVGLRELWNELLKQEDMEMKEEMKERNLIYFGAPGTGKSFTINEEYENGWWSSKERVTFHPDYSYANFVGAYKPYMKAAKEGEEQKITYAFVPGPFTRVLVNALRDPNGKHLLVIEEINRANTAAVFGDVFQLLDRGENGESEYAISPSQDLAKFLKEALTHQKPSEQKSSDGKEDEGWWWLTTEPLTDENALKERIRHLKIPSNMYLWATMNSADQGVFPMDTAFKRRWSFEYVGINDGATEFTEGLPAQWDALRIAINEKLVELKVNEDKCMGPFFLAKKDLADLETFLKVFKSKVLMYLFEDAARQKRSNVFADGLNTLSSIFNAVAEKFKKAEDKKATVFKDPKLEEALEEILALKKDNQSKPTTEEQAQAGGGESAQQESQGHA